jgi:formylglycine-generating enzyme required for sulfatase activity
MNKLTKIFNNIGCYCSSNTEGFLLNNTINGYQALDNSSIGYYIPYIVRNLKDNYKWEIGVGEVQYNGASIFVKRIEIASSSNNNNAETFIGDNNEFYLFVNNINFNSSFNNVILKNDHFQIDNVSSIYLIDNTTKNIDCVLPEAQNSRNVTIDIKALSSNYNIKVRTHDNVIFDSTNDSIRLVSDGQTWYVLNKLDNSVNFELSSQSEKFSAQSSPNGPEYSFQYKDGPNLAGSNLYWGSGDSNKLLLGSNSENNAHTIIPTSGNADVVFNKDLTTSSFKIYGSGSPQRNFWFSYDGRVGVNIPSGSNPQTVFHVVNYSCKEILRLENFSRCPAKLTLLHNPKNSTISNNSKVSILNLAGVNSVGVPRDYANITSIATDVVNSHGGIVLSVASGSAQQSLVSGDLSRVRLGYNNQSLTINNNGSINLSTNNSSINLNNDNISLSHRNLNLGTGNIQSTGPTTFSDLRVSNVTPSSLLTVDSNRRIVSISGLDIDPINRSIVLNNIQPNRLLSVDENKNIVGLYDLGDYFLTEKDITWNKYIARQCDVCLKQVIFPSPAPIDEFSINDQVEIRSGETLVYRQIKEIILNQDTIVELILDQPVTTNTTSAEIFSITKGGFLVMQKLTDEIESDSTSNILSIRPFTETVFNTGKKDINFTVYGTDTKPAFKVHANLGSVNRASGKYYNFATRNDNILPIAINNSGLGISSNFSSANYDYNSTRNQFGAKVSSVGSNGVSSYYGTYDQQGNVAEWLESSNLTGFVFKEYAAGGSYLTSGTLIIEDENGQKTEIDNTLSLRGINSFVAISGYEDVGFRVASLASVTDNDTITNIDKLNLSFVNVRDADNVVDSKPLMIDGESELLENLGVVNRNYRIGRYEVTNNQYSQFLNSIATGISDLTNSLYDIRMSGLLGGITRVLTYDQGPGKYSYSVKDNMSNKPVNFISYLNSLRFVNWLENNSPSGIDLLEVDSVVNQGAYDILSANDNIAEIITNLNRKYFLPSLNQWHKAAYFEYKESVVVSGSPVVTINKDTPDIVAQERVNEIAGQSLPEETNRKKVLANLTVDGWLVVDKIIVKNHTGQGRAFRSTLTDLGFDADTSDPNSDLPGTQSNAPANQPPRPSDNDGFRGNKFWLDPRSIDYGSNVFGTFAPPIVPNILAESAENYADCANLEDSVLETNNIPFWCKPLGKFIGPSFY